MGHGDQIVKRIVLPKMKMIFFSAHSKELIGSFFLFFYLSVQ